MIILGVILVIIGLLVAPLKILLTIGVIVHVVGLILNIVPLGTLLAGTHPARTPPRRDELLRRAGPPTAEPAARPPQQPWDFLAVTGVFAGPARAQANLHVGLPE